MRHTRPAAKERVTAMLDCRINRRAGPDLLRLHRKIDGAVLTRLDALAEPVATLAQRGERR